MQVTPMINIQMDTPKYGGGGRVYVKVQIEGKPWGAAATP